MLKMLPMLSKMFLQGGGGQQQQAAPAPGVAKPMQNFGGRYGGF
jgi:hypothetical protein